jgi:hypothetical protein
MLPRHARGGATKILFLFSSELKYFLVGSAVAKANLFTTRTQRFSPRRPEKNSAQTRKKTLYVGFDLFFSLFPSSSDWLIGGREIYSFSSLARCRCRPKALDFNYACLERKIFHKILNLI